jgi:hypothetical protein
MYKNNQPLHVQVLKIVVLLCMLIIAMPPIKSDAQTNPQSNQPAANQQRVYVGVTFLKIRPGKHDQYLQLIERYGKKINEYFYKKENLLGWYLYKILMPSGSTADYDFAAVNVVTGISSLLDPPGNQTELLKKVFPEMNDKMVNNLLARYDSVRIIVRREVFAPVEGAHTADTTNPVPAKYITVDLMHPASGKTEEYIKMERETYLPLHAERIRAGHLRNWGLYQKVFADERAGFEYVTVNYYDNLDKLGEGFEDALKKVMPQTNANTLFNQTMATRNMIRTELWKLMYYVDRSNTKK